MNYARGEVVDLDALAEAIKEKHIAGAAIDVFPIEPEKYGEGRRVFKMSPLHHHYQKLGYSEPKIVTRFWIIGILLAVITIVTLKLR